MGTIWFPLRAKRDKGEETHNEEHNPSQEYFQIDEEPEGEPTLSYVEEETQWYNKNYDLCTNHI